MFWDKFDKWRPVSFQRLFFDFRDGKFVLGRRDRRDLPHLTVLWKTQSGELDIHLNDETNNPDAYESLLRIPKTDALDLLKIPFEGYAEDFKMFLQTCGRYYRPGWLTRNGYLAVWLPPERRDPWLDEFVKVKRRKYRVANFKEFCTVAPFGLEDCYYSCSILHILPKLGGPVLPVTVSCNRKRVKKRGSLIVLSYHPGRGWWGIPNSLLSGSRMKRVVETNFGCVLARFRSVAERIHEALQLHETDLDLVSNIPWADFQEKYDD